VHLQGLPNYQSWQLKVYYVALWMQHKRIKTISLTHINADNMLNTYRAGQGHPCLMFETLAFSEENEHQRLHFEMQHGKHLHKPTPSQWPALEHQVKDLVDG